MRDQHMRPSPSSVRSFATWRWGILVGAALLVGSATGLPAFAQQVQRIAAVVNDDVVTQLDLQERLGLVMMTSGLPNTQETQQKLVPRVLQQLIDERLKLQEAKRQGVTVSDEDIDNAKRQIEKNNKFPEGSLDGMVARGGVDPKTLERQLRADVAWIRVAQSSLRRQVSVEPQEISAVLDTLRENLGKPQRLLAEIVLPVETPDAEAQTRALADKLVQEVRNGGNFQALARQFSASGTAAVGGDLGWVSEGQLDPDVMAALKTLSPKQVSDPIRTSTGYEIILLREVKTSEAPNPDARSVQLSQLYMPTQGPAAVPEATRAELASSLAETAKDCSDVNRIAKEMDLPSSGPLGMLKMGDLPPPVRAAVNDLPDNKISPLIPISGAEVLVMVCERADASGLPSRQDVEQKIGQEKLERAAQRKLRDLRRAALIDIRL